MIEAFLAFVETVLLTAIPVLAFLTLYSWLLAWRKRPYRLPFVIALVNTVDGGAVAWLAFTVLYRARVGPVPVELLPVTATAVMTLVLMPFLITTYLVVLEARRPE